MKRQDSVCIYIASSTRTARHCYKQANPVWSLWWTTLSILWLAEAHAGPGQENVMQANDDGDSTLTVLSSARCRSCGSMF